MFAAVSPEVTVENNTHKMIISFGKFGVIRNDIDESANGENGARLWKYIENEVAPYT